MTAIELIKAERAKQIAKGYNAAHDDAEEQCELLVAALKYIYQGSVFDLELRVPAWPWEHESWKPSDDLVVNLVKAGALIVAEIERLQRLPPGVRHATE